MAKSIKKGIGMMERVVVQRDVSDFADANAFALAFFDALDANCIPKNVRAGNAERSRKILAMAGIELGDIESVRKLATYSEDSAEKLAAEWLRTFRYIEALKEKAASGDATAVNDLIDEAEHLGVTQERMWWRCCLDYSTGKRRESLALSGRDQVKGGINGNAMKTDNSFATLHSVEAQTLANEISARNPNLSWTAIIKNIASKYGVSQKTVKNALLNPKRMNKGG